MKINIDDRVINLIEPLMKGKLDEKEMQEVISLMLIRTLDNYVDSGGKGVNTAVLENLKDEYSQRVLKQLLTELSEDE